MKNEKIKDYREAFELTKVISLKKNEKFITFYKYEKEDRLFCITDKNIYEIHPQEKSPIEKATPKTLHKIEPLKMTGEMEVFEEILRNREKINEIIEKLGERKDV